MISPPIPTSRRAAVPLMAVAGFLTASGMLIAQPIPLGPEFRVNTHTAGVQRRPAAAASGVAAAVFGVTWEGASLDDPDAVLIRRFNIDGGPLGPELRVNTYTTSAQHSPSIASKGSNQFVVAWQSDGQDGDQGGIYAQRIMAGGSPLGGEFRVNSYTTSSQGVPSVASDSAGNFVVVWASLGQDGSGYGIFGQRYAQSGAPLGGQFRVNTYTTGFQGHPAAGMDPTGFFVVVWEGEGAEDAFGISGQRYSSAGVPLGGEFRVNSTTVGNQRYPAADVDFGRFAVVWQSDIGGASGYDVFSAVFTQGGNFGSENLVNTVTAGAQTHPSMATNPNSLDCAIAWEDDTQDPQGGIYERNFYGCFGPIDANFHVNTYTAGVQNRPAVAVVGNRVLIVWTSEQDPDGSLGVYGQRLQPGWIPVELQTFTIE